MNNQFDELPKNMPRSVTRRKALKRFGVGLAGWVLVIGFCAGERAGAAGFQSTGAMTVARESHTATLLPNGKVLVAGGWNDASGLALSSAELYDPTNGKWSATAPMAAARYGHTATLLTNGLVLVVGGNDGYLSSCELYNPANSSWTTTGSLTVGRVSHTATLLQNGKVVVAGGFTASGADFTAELYDPSTGTWSPTGSLNWPRYNHTASLLQNGKVLVAGGTGNAYTSELYDPATETWSYTGLMDQFGRHLEDTATVLPNGKVLVAGSIYIGLTGHMSSVTTELYDPAFGTWTTGTSMNEPRYEHTATLLPNGQLLVTGGVSDPNTLASAELYDVTSGSWTETGSMAHKRTLHTATLLTNGLVLIAGGWNGAKDLSSVELYDTSSGPLPVMTTLTSATLLADGSFQFDFTNVPGTHFRVASSPTLESPIGDWTILDNVSETSSGQFQFIDTQATNFSRRFYLLISP